MWDDTRRQHFDCLRRREAEGNLDGNGAAELEALFAELDEQEQQALAEALQRSQRRQLELRAQNDRLAEEAGQLERIRGEYQQLLTNARLYLDELRARRASLADEYRDLTGRELTAAP